MSEQQDKRTDTIRSITSPLGFFVLALLIIETFLGVALVRIEDVALQQVALFLGVAMFFALMVIVFFLVWHRPSNLIFDQEMSYKQAELEHGKKQESVVSK